jgi:hypothetical protein
MKTKVISFRGKYSIPSEIKLNNNSTTEKVLNFGYLRVSSNFTHNYEDLNKKTYKFRSIYGVNLRTLKRKLEISIRLWRSQSLYIAAYYGR